MFPEIYKHTDANKMEMIKDYTGAAATTGATAYLLTKVLSGGSADKSTYGSMSIVSMVGVAEAFGSLSSKLTHEYVLPHIAQDEKWKTMKAAGLNLTALTGGSLGYVWLMDPSIAKVDTLPITLYSLSGDILGTYLYDYYTKPMWAGSYSG